MKIYEVGGAVRDFLLGIKPHDTDYVVVGSSQSEMLKKGFIQVGKAFPVFLHPETKAEYALARKERKIGNKHTDFAFDFSPEISLEEDLRRRDFTCNALARDIETGKLIDITGGVEDIKNHVLRHIDSVHFVEDPLRILRMCRFAAQLDFSIAPQTMELAKKMVAENMLIHLSKDRFREEFFKALQSKNFSRFIAEMENCRALDFLLPNLSNYLNFNETHKQFYTNLRKAQNSKDIIKFALLFAPIENSQEIMTDCKRIKIAKRFSDFALYFNEYRQYFISEKVQDSVLFDMLKKISKFKNYDIVEQLFEALNLFGINVKKTEIRSKKIFSLCLEFKANQMPNFAKLPKNNTIQQKYKDFILQKL